MAIEVVWPRHTWDYLTVEDPDVPADPPPLLSTLSNPDRRLRAASMSLHEFRANQLVWVRRANVDAARDATIQRARQHLARWRSPATPARAAPVLAALPSVAACDRARGIPVPAHWSGLHEVPTAPFVM